MKHFFQSWIFIFFIIGQTSVSIAQTNTASSLANCEFNSIKLTYNSSEPVVYCFYQTKQGEMWVGSSNGLSKYDGYSVKTYNHIQSDSNSISNSRVYRFLQTANGEFYAGTFKGLNRYDEKTDKFILLKYTANYSITSLLEDKDGNIWAGTNVGLLKYNPANNLWAQFSRESQNNPFPSNYIACNLIDNEGTIYAGTYDYLCRKSIHQSQFDKIRLPFYTRFKNNLLLSICKNIDDENSLWLGTEHGLFTMNTKNGKSAISLSGMAIKCLYYDNEQNLWVGTDNGLYIKPKGSQMFIEKKHDVDNSHSIPNNVIWSIFIDRNLGLWLGTDDGIATTQTSKKFTFTSFKGLTGNIGGNQVNTILRDSHNFLWLGGTNGLISFDLKTHQSRWFKADDSKQFALTHNKVRYLYEDSFSLWIATDAGLNRYDFKTKTLSHYIIHDSKDFFNSNWMYYIHEDANGLLWLATYEGGVFVVSKSDLLNSKSDKIIAKAHYGTNEGQRSISSNTVNSLTAAKDGSIWIGTDDAGVNYINPLNNKISLLDRKNGGLNTNFVNSIMSDYSGNIWIFTDSGISRIPANGKSAFPYFKEELNSRISFYAFQGDRLWLKDKEGVKCLDTKTGQIKNIFLDNRVYSSAYYSTIDNKMYMGANDGFIEFSPDTIYSQQNKASLSITNLLVSNKLIKVGVSYDKNVILKESLFDQKAIDLNFNQNTFTLEFSAFLFEKSANIGYAHRLKEYNNEWQQNDGSNNKATFTNVSPGSYTFEVRTIEGNGKLSKNIATLNIKIKAPWYQSIWALLVYFVIIAFILYQFWRLFRYRQLLRFERMERKKMLELIKMKTDFFVNVSHEFKTPLSLIIGHVSQLVVDEPETAEKKKLQSIQKNAQKIHLLISQMLDFSNDKSTIQLMPSETSLVDFVKEIFDQFEKEFATNNINAEFISDNISYPFLIDRVKMESVFTNLLSNALKFVTPQGTIRVAINKVEESDSTISVLIKVEDNGFGISEEDLPKVFDRYFKSSDSKHLNKEGSGIGLSLVKSIIDEHGGSVSIQSKKDIGTTVFIRLSTKKIQRFIKTKNESAIDLFNVSKLLNLAEKPTILLIEDNSDIREFIVETLSLNYNFLTAEDGKKGLEIASKYPLDLIITDITMPGINGLEVCRILKDNMHTAFIPIIVLTAKADTLTEMNAFLEQADAFIPKPFDINYLSGRITQLILKKKGNEDKIREKDITTPREEVLPSPDEKFLKEITSLIEECLQNVDLNVTTLNQKSGLGDKHIYRKIKQLTGMTVVEYIRNIRLKKAAMFLKQDKLSISEVLYLVGFSTPSYFTKCFKEEYGMTPKEFVLKNKTQNNGQSEI